MWVTIILALLAVSCLLVYLERKPRVPRCSRCAPLADAGAHDYWIFCSRCGRKLKAQ